ncbi:DUF637 domain-containing protein, partial [Ralstonia solanacearum]
SVGVDRYVSQSVPDPSCMSGACPMVTALVPQVYLPPGYSGIEPGGSIVASKSLELLANNPIQNTGTLGSYGTLTTNTTIVNEQRAAEMTAAWQPIEDGWARTTGQVGQVNSGFMFAANAADIAGQVQNLNGVLAQLNADGSMSANEAARVASAVRAGQQAVTSTHTETFVRSPDIMGQLFAGVVIAMIAVMTGGAAMAAYAGAGAVLTTGEIMAQAAISSMTASSLQQASGDQGFNFGKILTAGAVGAITAGIANGIAVNANGTLGIADQASQGNTLARLAGAQSVPGTTMTQAAASTTTNLLQRVEAVLVMSAANAGVNTIAYGGSFGRSFLNSLATNTAAIAAYNIGSGVPGIGSPVATPDTIVANIALHALAGCASSAVQGTGCAGGAVGAATSAILAPLMRDALYGDAQTSTLTDNGNGTATLTTNYSNPAINAAVVALSTMAGGAVANAIGANANAGAAAAQNEALNNALTAKQSILKRDQLAAATSSSDALAIVNRWDRTDLAQTKTYQGLTDAKDAYALASTPEEKAAAYQKLQGAVANASVLFRDFQANGDSGGMATLAKAMLSATVDMQLASRDLGLPLSLSPEQAQALAQQYMQFGIALGASEGTSLANSGLAKGLQSLARWLGGFAGAGTALDTVQLSPTITNNSGPYSSAQGGAPATAVRAGPGYTAADVVPSGSAANTQSVWDLAPTTRGVAIESQLARTEYSPANGWYNVGAANNGYFPLVDFQNGNTLVSLKSVDTTGSSWQPRMETVIDQLAAGRATVNGTAANMVLDIRVQPGGAAAAQSLVSYGAERGVIVNIKVFP